MAQVVPYLNFDNNCREAMSFYKACFGGELMLQTVGESPMMAAQMPPEMKDSILHSSLTNGAFSLLASDLNRDTRIEGNTVHLCVNCGSEEEINGLFSKLAAGGTVLQPVADMPWGAKYGELTDKYGKHWMFNFQLG